MNKSFAKVEVDLLKFSKLMTKGQKYDDLIKSINQVVDVHNNDGVVTVNSNFEALVMSLLPNILDIENANEIKQLEIRNFLS